MDSEGVIKFEEFIKNTVEEEISPRTASERFDYIRNSVGFFPYIPESWIYSKALYSSLYYGDKAKRYDDALKFLEEQYPKYCKLCKYDYQWKASINFSWAVILEKTNKHYDALLKTKIGVLMQFVDNVTYDNWEFFSFRACTKYVLSEIADEEISLIHPDEFNDPMDTVLLKWLKNQEDNAIDTLGRTLAKNNIDALSNLRVRCFSRFGELPYHEEANGILEKRRKQKQDVLKINPLMWSHYADEHKGICIKYSFKSEMFQLLNEDETVITRFGNIDYKKSLNINDFEIPIRDALFAKSKVWEYEHEVRLVYYSTGDTPNVMKIKVPGAIKEIYLGLRCPEADERIIKSLVKGKNIPIYRIYTDINDVYKLRKKLIN